MVPFCKTLAQHNLPWEAHPALGFAKRLLYICIIIGIFQSTFTLVSGLDGKVFLWHLTGAELDVLTRVENMVLETRLPRRLPGGQAMGSPPKSEPSREASSAAKAFPGFFKREETRTRLEWKTQRKKQPCFCLWGAQSCAMSIATEREGRERPKKMLCDDLWGWDGMQRQTAFPRTEFCLDSVQEEAVR